MNKNIITIVGIVIAAFILLAIILVGCNLTSSQDTTPTLDTTQAYETVQARLTEAVALTPTKTITPTETQQPTATATSTPVTPTATLAAVSPTVTNPPQGSCDQASPGNPIDVTVPDDTVMEPGQNFSKTWRLVNSGTCTWNTEYSLVWFSGERLEAPAAVSLQGSVAPGESVDLTVDMVAPAENGTFQSNWKLRNAAGQLFGIGSGEGLPFYVRIVVDTGLPTSTPTTGPSPTVTAGPSPTATTGPTPTSTPQPDLSGSAILFPADQLDLDTLQVNSSGADIVYQQDQGSGALSLSTLESTAFGIYGGFQPAQADCEAANLVGGQISLGDLAVGTYLCFRSGAANLGWMRISGFNQENNRLDLEVYTWLSSE